MTEPEDFEDGTMPATSNFPPGYIVPEMPEGPIEEGQGDEPDLDTEEDYEIHEIDGVFSIGWKWGPSDPGDYGVNAYSSRRDAEAAVKIIAGSNCQFSMEEIDKLSILNDPFVKGLALAASYLARVGQTQAAEYVLKETGYFSFTLLERAGVDEFDLDGVAEIFGRKPSDYEEPETSEAYEERVQATNDATVAEEVRIEKLGQGALNPNTCPYCHGPYLPDGRCKTLTEELNRHSILLFEDAGLKVKE